MSNLIDWGWDGGSFALIFQIVTLEIKVTDQRGEYEDYRHMPQMENAQTTDTKLCSLSLPSSPPSPLFLALSLSPSYPFFSFSSSFLPSLFLLWSPYFGETELLQKAMSAGL